MNTENQYSAEDVVIPAQEAIAVYENKNGDISIRQVLATGEEDHIVVVSKKNVLDLIAALQNIIG